MTTLTAKYSIDNIWPVNNKKVLMRVDFNVPIKDGTITNDLRIRSALPSIQKILAQGGSVILMSHLGRPSGIVYEEGKSYTPADFMSMSGDSLRPIAARLEELLKTTVLFAEDSMAADQDVAQLKPGQVLLLENVRFYKNESSKKEDERLVMARKLATYGDIFVSDAFGTAHRNAATMTGIPSVLGHGAAGYLMNKEITAFRQIMQDPPHPLTAIVGGAKVSDKILLLENLLKKVDKLMIGGAMAYTFLKATGHKIGKSYCQEDDIVELAKKLLDTAKANNVEVFLPLDHVCHTEFAAVDSPLVTDGVDIPDGYMALDIGPKTIELYRQQVQASKACLWNGPMGVFEMDCYSKGTFAIAGEMATQTQNTGMLSIIGGGDSASAAELSGHAPNMSHVSTGGGASLELLEGKDLPGLAILTSME